MTLAVSARMNYTRATADASFILFNLGLHMEKLLAQMTRALRMSWWLLQFTV